MAFLIDRSIALSILDADFFSLQNTLPYLIDAGIKNIHFDVMDGNFVPNISFGSKIISDIMKKIDRVAIDSSAHLMMIDAYKHLDSFLKSGVNRVVVHVEDKETIKFLLNNLASQKEKLEKFIGLSINPRTKVSEIPLELLKICREVLVMTVNPGLGGQMMIEDCLEKTKELINLQELYKLNFIITVDGGINQKTIEKAKDYPIDQFVVGSAIWKSLKNASEIMNSIQGKILQGRPLKK